MHTAFQLTPREHEVADLLRKGKSAGEIATLLDLQPNTIYQYILIIKEKYEAPHLVGLIVTLCKN